MKRARERISESNEPSQIHVSQSNEPSQITSGVRFYRYIKCNLKLFNDYTIDSYLSKILTTQHNTTQQMTKDHNELLNDSHISLSY